MRHTRGTLLIAPIILAFALGCATEQTARSDREKHLELNLHSITPDLELIEFDGRRVWMTRDERRVLSEKGGFEEALASPRASGHTIYATLINHTDTSYLLTFDLAEGVPVGVLKDPDGRNWRFEQVLINGGPAPYNLLSVAQTERLAVVRGGIQRLIQSDTTHALGRVPPTPDHLPDWLEYEFHDWEYPARIIHDGKIGEHTTVPMSGSGRVNLTTTGPIQHR